jgi:hypothetical protein
MAPPHTQKSPQREGRYDLAINSLQKHQISSQRQAAEVFKVYRTTLQRRVRGIGPREGSQTGNRLLLPVEEDVLIQWILAMDQRGIPSSFIDVKRLAENLIQNRGNTRPTRPIGINWPYRFIERHPAIQAVFSRAKDSQRSRQERSSVIRPWFLRVQEYKTRYGIVDADVYNFDETGFAMGLITRSGSRKIITSSENVGRVAITQPGNREWITSIECINALGQIIPPFIIMKGKKYLKHWYDQFDLPPNTSTNLSDNGWTNDQLALRWIYHFDTFTKHQTLGTHRLLIMDGHGSHATPEFDQYCTDHQIITICMPSHTSHLLQPLDVGCFGSLKTAYGRLITDLARRSIFHVDKADFLSMYHQARKQIFSETTIQNSFKATGLIPYNPERVLS